MNLVRTLAGLAAGLLVSVSAFANEGGNLLHSGTDLGDRASLQRGAQLYMNYCSGCHSLKYLRYSRLSEDLGLSEEQVMQNLNLSGGKIGEQILVSLNEADANKWFGKMAAGPEPDRPRAWQRLDLYLPEVVLSRRIATAGLEQQAVPQRLHANPLWQMQGLQHAEYGEPDKATAIVRCHGLKVTTPGTQTPAQFDQSVRDITTFLEYAGERPPSSARSWACGWSCSSRPSAS
jgi:ubiquinol-cytochrome c reductase cytochrome c1 subunit